MKPTRDSVTIQPGTEADWLDFWRQHTPRIDIPFELFRACLHDWSIWQVHGNNGKRIATMAQRGKIGHVARFGSERVGCAAIASAMDALGITETDVTDAFLPGRALAKRLGFTAVSHDAGVTHYVRVPHDPQ